MAVSTDNGGSAAPTRSLHRDRIGGRPQGRRELSQLGTRRRWQRKAPLVAALLVFAVAVGAGVLATVTSKEHWNAEASLVLFPRSSRTAMELPGFYETLSHGQIVSTLAQFSKARANGQGEKNIQFAVVPETSVITITATADSAQQSESLANEALKTSLTDIEQLQLPYTGRPVADATNQAKAVSSSRIKQIAIVVAVASVLGVLVYQSLGVLLRWRRERSDGARFAASDRREEKSGSTGSRR